MIKSEAMFPDGPCFYFTEAGINNQKFANDDEVYDIIKEKYSVIRTEPV